MARPSVKHIVFSLIFLILLLAPVEIASRAYWVRKAGLSFWAPDPIDLFYPQIKKIRQASIRQDDGSFDILFLGGSVLYDVARQDKSREILQTILGDPAGKTVRVFNASYPGHSSLDSVFKYESLKKQRFDLVLMYDSINEVRANNCPPGMFRDDYSHYSWYGKLNFFRHYPFFRILTFPYTVHSLTVDIRVKKNPRSFVPTDIPDAEWTRYGHDIRTAGPFRKNMEKITSLARKRGEPVLLIGFAFHVPRDYSEIKFNRKMLDYGYGENAFPLEIWGRPENVIKGVLAHNDILAGLASREKTLYLDANAFLPHDGRFFRDVCHLTDTGVETFAGILGLFLRDQAVGRPR
ncbi:MAG: hypothetical protein Q8Q08_04320 [Candidatus Omnitrophota bacterium]|nr:hypothetical protein [Candidatus Omnitrophota bacterium]MDZ4241334.1 hypothetical protein [Candidatus Omnitrophota bacterium]